MPETTIAKASAKNVSTDSATTTKTKYCPYDSKELIPVVLTNKQGDTLHGMQCPSCRFIYNREYRKKSS